MPLSKSAVAALLVLSGCAGRYDGTWLVFYTMRSNSAAPDSDEIGHTRQTFASLRRTRDQAVLELGGTVMVGTLEDKDIEASVSSGMDFADATCAVGNQTMKQEFSGEITEDLGLEGEMTLVETLKIADCDWSPDLDQRSTTVYDIEGMLLNSRPGAHSAEDANWGYIPFGIY